MSGRRLAFGLLFGTLLYNLGEGAVALREGLRADSLVLMGFGADSYLEVLAAGAVIWRLSYDDEERGERAEVRALRLIGGTFIVLAAAVVFQGSVNLWTRQGAEDSLIGIGLLVASLLIMPVLAVAKLRVAAKDDLPALAAEARETAVCFYLSATALAGLIAAAALGWWWIDPIFALVMVPWLVKEGIEGLLGEACFDGALLCCCRECWFGLGRCTDQRTGARS